MPTASSFTRAFLGLTCLAATGCLGSEFKASSAGSLAAKGSVASPLDALTARAAAGVHWTRGDVERARDRFNRRQAPFAESCDALVARADAPYRPFKMTQPLGTLTYGWCGGDTDGVDNTVGELRDRAQNDMSVALAAASKFVLKNDAAAGARAVEILEAWNAEATLPTLYDLNVDFANATMDGATSDFCSARPWNMALDFGWVTYGLKDAAEVYAILDKNEYPLTPDNRAHLTNLIRRFAVMTDSSLKAWTEYARLHRPGPTVDHYKADNHVGIYLSGLAAAAAALGDDAMMEYVVNGTAYDFGAGPKLANYVPLKAYLENALVADPADQTVTWADIGWKKNYRTYHAMTQISLGHTFKTLDVNYAKERGLYAGFKTARGFTALDAAVTWARYLTGELGGGAADVRENQNALPLEYAVAPAADAATRALFKTALTRELKTGAAPRVMVNSPYATSVCFDGADPL